MGRLQEMRGRLDGPACADDPQQVQQLRERIWKTENPMVREAERILESNPEIPLRQTYIEKLDAELQTLGWLARFPEKIDSPYTNRQLLDKYGILPGISPAEQYGQIGKAFRELDARPDGSPMRTICSTSCGRKARSRRNMLRKSPQYGRKAPSRRLRAVG